MSFKPRRLLPSGQHRASWPRYLQRASRWESRGPNPIFRAGRRLFPTDRWGVSSKACEVSQPLEGDAGEDLRAERRKLIERVDFIPLEGLAKFDPRAHGSLTVLLGLGLGDASKAENPTAGSHGVSLYQSLTSGCEVMLGAGAGFEPATFRL